MLRTFSQRMLVLAFIFSAATIVSFCSGSDPVDACRQGSNRNHRLARTRHILFDVFGFETMETVAAGRKSQRVPVTMNAAQ